MKLALVNLDMSQPDPPLSLAYMASYVRKYSDVDDITIVDKEDHLKRIKRERPDVVGISSFSFEFTQAKALAQEIKKNFDIPVIVGGHHITGLPKLLLSSPFDIGVMGEGEQTMLELVKCYEKHGAFPKDELKKIDGIVFKNNSEALITKRRELIVPLDKIPFPARDLLKMKEYYLTLRMASFSKFGIYTHMMTSRGCPYNCTFCSSVGFWGRRPRYNSPEHVVSEFKELIEKYDVDGIIIWDDLFVSDIKRVEQIAKLMKEEGINDKIELTIFCRANLINESLCKTLKEMSVSVVDFGLESGSDKVLKYLKKGTVTVEDNKRAIRLCKKFGMRTIGTFVIGSPDETEEDLKMTRELILDKNLDRAQVYQVTPIPNSEMWDYARKLGIVSDDPDFDFSLLNTAGFKPSLLMTKNLSKEKFEEWLNLLSEDARRKPQRINAVSAISTLRPKHLKFLFTRRFFSKVAQNSEEIANYLKNLI